MSSMPTQQGDSTERNVAAAPVHMSDEWMRAFLENSAVAAWLKDEAGRHVFISENCQRRLGVPEGWQGKTEFEIWPAEIAENFRRNDLAVLEGGKAIELLEEAVAADGTRSWWLSHKFSFRDAGGKRYVGGLAVDITARIQAEAALRASEERLQLSQQVAHVGTFDLDIKTGVNVWTSELEAMHGLPAGGFARTKPAWENLVHPEDRAQALAKVELALRTGQPVEGEWRVVWPDGSVHWLAARWQAFMDASGQPVRMAGVNIDITKRKRAEEELQRLNKELERRVEERTEALRQRLDELTILNRVGVICSDSRTEDELLNRATALIADRLFPDNCGFLLLDAARGVLAPHASFVISDAHVIKSEIPLEKGITGQVARTGQALRVGDVTTEPAYLAADSRTRSELCVPIKIADRVVGVVNVESQLPDAFSATDEQLMTALVDIVGNALERLRSEQQLRRRERDLGDFVENASVGMHWVGPNGRILWANRAELEMLGYRRDEYVGHHIAHFHADADVTADLLSRLISERSVQNFEARLRCKDGSLRWLLINSSAYIEDGQFIHTRCFTRDITERKELEREVIEIATLEQERIGQDLHDDCGQQLTALGLLADGLVEALREHAPQDVDIAQKIQRQIKAVLRQVRTIARGLAQAEVDAEELPAALAELTARLAETSGVRCDFRGEKIDSGNGRVQATHLYHIAQEACTNALKHAQASNIEVRLRASDAAVVLEIQDDGLGIPRDDREGLGRRIMRNRASLIGARLTIAPAKPRGTLVSCAIDSLNSLDSK